MDYHALGVILISALVTILIRFAPFIIFKNKLPEPIRYLGKVLPGAIMVMLVVYCLKSVSITSGSHGIPEAISLLLVYIVHKWKHSTIFSILVGTISYMLLIQFVFI